MNRACGLGALALAALFAFYLALLWPRIGWLPAAMLGVLCTIGTGTLAGGIGTLWTNRGIARALRRSVRGEAFEDGEITAAIGTVEPAAEPLTSPFLGRSCVAFEYDVEPGTGSGHGGSDYTGIALVPAAIHTQRGAVRLLGFPVLDHFPRARARDAALANARTFVERTDFEAMEGLEKVKLFGHLHGALTDDDGRVEKHWRLADAEQDISDRRFSERSVPVGERVCAVGAYSMEQRGLRAGRGLATPIEIVPGDADAAHRALVQGKRSGAIFGLIFFVLIHAFLAAVLLLAPPGG